MKTIVPKISFGIFCNLPRVLFYILWYVLQSHLTWGTKIFQNKIFPGDYKIRRLLVQFGFMWYTAYIYMCVCMCVCICVYVYVCVYVCVCVCMYVCVYVCVCIKAAFSLLNISDLRQILHFYQFYSWSVQVSISTIWQLKGINFKKVPYFSQVLSTATGSSLYNKPSLNKINLECNCCILKCLSYFCCQFILLLAVKFFSFKNSSLIYCSFHSLYKCICFTYHWSIPYTAEC